MQKFGPPGWGRTTEREVGRPMTYIYGVSGKITCELVKIQVTHHITW